MLNIFVCGTFHREEDDHEACCKSPDSSPRKSKRNSFCRSHGKGSKNINPYSTLGQDKFSALVADLNEKRQKIYSQMSPQEISFVRFVPSNTDDFVPVVVKVKKKDKKHKSEELTVRHVPSKSEAIIMDKSAIVSSAAVEEIRKQPNLESDKKAEKKRLSNWNMWRQPSYYMPVVTILILVFLAMFGRSVATLCICIVWYIVPTLKDSSKSRKTLKKKDYVRGLSEKKKVSDGLDSPRNHGHRKSW